MKMITHNHITIAVLHEDDVSDFPRKQLQGGESTFILDAIENQEETIHLLTNRFLSKHLARIYFPWSGLLDKLVLL
jgi:hypothetical protein